MTFIRLPSSPPALKDILHMVSTQWDQLQWQIRRQHGCMLRALRCIQARLFYTSQSHEAFRAPLDSSTNGKAPSSAEGLKVSSQQTFKLYAPLLVCFYFFGSYLVDPSLPAAHRTGLQFCLRFFWIQNSWFLLAAASVQCLSVAQ